MQDVVAKREEHFHDGWARTIAVDDVLVDETFQACTSPENRLILERLGDIRGKKILELGCGAGEASVYFAKQGASVTATDISPGMLDVVQKVSCKHGVTVETKKCSACDIAFPDSSFDIVYAANLLHHVDIEETLSEVKRVLKEGGMFVAWDPLIHNPAINIYRSIAREVRTDDEHPLHMKDLDLFRKHFSSVSFETTWFFTLWIFARFYFIDKVDPNKERYWKKIITDSKKLEKTYYKLEKLDKLFLKGLPFLKRYCWNIVVFAVK